MVRKTQNHGFDVDHSVGDSWDHFRPGQGQFKGIRDIEGSRSTDSPFRNGRWLRPTVLPGGSMIQSTLGNHQDSVDHTDPDELDRLYNEEGLLIREIAERAGVTPSTVSRHMAKHDVDRRSRSEAATETHRVEYAGYHVQANGYCEWRSRFGDETDVVYVHRLLAVAEYGFDALYGTVVHHRDDIPWLNYAENIELMSRSDHSRQHQQGAGGSNADLTEEEAKRIKKLAHSGDMTQYEIANEYGISQAQVSSIKLGESWAYLPDPE